MSELENEMPWTPIEFRDVRVGDAITIRMLMCSPNGGAATPLHLSGRVVGRGISRALFVEWTAATGREECAPRLFVEKILVAEDTRNTHLRYMPSEGPVERTDDAGRAHLLALLTAACGGDPAVLATCVDYSTRKRLTLREAEEILAGRLPVREHLIRQCDGRLPRKGPPMHEAEIRKALQNREPDPHVAAILRAMPGAQVREVRVHTPLVDESAEPKIA